MKKTVFISLLLTFTSLAQADINDLPIEVRRGPNGQIEHVLINHGKSPEKSASQFLNELRASLDQASKSLHAPPPLSGFEKLKREDQETYLQAVQMLEQKDLRQHLYDSRVQAEFLKASSEFHKTPFFKLIAAPYNPTAFDEEQLIAEAIERAIDLAGQVLPSSPLLSVFEFLVSEYFEALTSQREFYQNAFLYRLEHDESFTAEEKSRIKSSIFYSRLDLWNLPARKKAQKAWLTFGDKELKSFQKKCKTDSSTVLQSCFFMDKNVIRNRMYKSHTLARSQSRTFNYDSPSSAATERWFILAAKLGLKLLPAPGLAKTPVKGWLNSFYQKQRKSEGMIYAAAVARDQSNLAAWIRHNTVNPLID